MAAKGLKDRLLLVSPTVAVQTRAGQLGDPSSYELGGPSLWGEPGMWASASASGKGRGAERAGPKKRSLAIVEDERDLLSAYTTYLKGQGYDVISAFSDGEEFLRAMASGEVTPDLVIMDYRLPGLNGIVVGKEVTRIRPQVRVLITTADDKTRRAADSAGFGFLLKPFTLRALTQSLDVL